MLDDLHAFEKACDQRSLGCKRVGLRHGSSAAAVQAVGRLRMTLGTSRKVY